MRHHLETGISFLLALAVVGVGCGICLLGTMAVRGDISWTLGGAQYRVWLIREREGVGLALSQTVPYRNPEGASCQRTRVWFWLWTPRLELQSVDYQECAPLLPVQGQADVDNRPPSEADPHKGFLVGLRMPVVGAGLVPARRGTHKGCPIGIPLRL